MSIEARTSSRGAFAEHAIKWRQLGYSPIPIDAGGKSPSLKRWSDAGRQPLSVDRILRLAKQMPLAGLSFALGHERVVRVDIDVCETGEAVILADTLAVLPPSPLIKTGRKGLTLLCRAETDRPEARHVLRPDKSGLIDIIGYGGQTAFPPSIHPAGTPYRWRGARGSPGNRVLIEELPLLTAKHISDLFEAVKPWAAQPKARSAASSLVSVECKGPLAEQLQRRYRAYARAALRRKTEALGTTAPGGHNRGRFEMVAAVGCYLHNRLLTKQELWEAVRAVTLDNGFLKEHGEPAVVAVVRNGLRFSENDELPRRYVRECAHAA